MEFSISDLLLQFDQFQFLGWLQEHLVSWGFHKQHFDFELAQVLLLACKLAGESVRRYFLEASV